MAKKVKRPSLDLLREQAEALESGRSDTLTKETIREMYPCPTCDNLHSDSLDAGDCCSDKIDAVYVCTKCDGWEDGDEEARFTYEDECLEHIKTDHGIDADLEDVEVRYLDALREGKANAQWAFEMEATTEFLIPVEQTNA